MFAKEEGILTRAWESLLPYNCIPMYSLQHGVDDELRTPIRDHIRFPKVKCTVQEINSLPEDETKLTSGSSIVKKQKG